jgi:hypothetical protein
VKFQPSLGFFEVVHSMLAHLVAYAFLWLLTHNFMSPAYIPICVTIGYLTTRRVLQRRRIRQLNASYQAPAYTDKH